MLLFLAYCSIKTSCTSCCSTVRAIGVPSSFWSKLDWLIGSPFTVATLPAAQALSIAPDTTTASPAIRRWTLDMSTPLGGQCVEAGPRGPAQGGLVRVRATRSFGATWRRATERRPLGAFGSRSRLNGLQKLA